MVASFEARGCRQLFPGSLEGTQFRLLFLFLKSAKKMPLSSHISDATWRITIRLGGSVDQPKEGLSLVTPGSSLTATPARAKTARAVAQAIAMNVCRHPATRKSGAFRGPRIGTQSAKAGLLDADTGSRSVLSKLTYFRGRQVKHWNISLFDRCVECQHITG